MQPHSNLGIRFRTHFRPFGFSEKRSLSNLKDKIRSLYLDGHRGIYKMSFVRESVGELERLIKEIRRPK